MKMKKLRRASKRVMKKRGNNPRFFVGSWQSTYPHADCECGPVWGYTAHMHPLLRYLGVVAAVLLTVNIVPGIAIYGGWTTTLLVALVWSVIVVVIRPVLQLLTLPITVLTLGLFSFVLNALLFWAMAFVVPGFTVSGFWAALIGALVLSVLSWLIEQLL